MELMKILAKIKKKPPVLSMEKEFAGAEAATDKPDTEKKYW